MSPEPESTQADTPAVSDAPELVAVGAATVDRTYEVTNLPEPDGGAFAHSVSDSFGGVGANVAIGVARLGRETGLLSRLGEDEFADRVEANLDASPIDTSLVRRHPGTTTHCIIPRGPAGDRMIDAVDTTGAGDAFVAALIDRWLLGEADPATAGEFAAAAAALNCTAEGARGGLADTETVRAFLTARGR